jgi:peroxiredoxin Q/BCP
MKWILLLLIILLFPIYLFSKDKSLLKVGMEAPDFALVSDRGDTVQLASFRDTSKVVLIFYPGNETPLCTRQLCEIRDSYSAFKEKGSVVFGINPADQKSHQAFVKKHTFQFPLLVDKDKQISKVYGTHALFMQKRTVYVIDKNGKITYAKRGKPSVKEIMKALE